MSIEFTLARTTPRHVAAVGVPVHTDGPVPRQLGLSRAALTAAGFEGKVGQVLSIPAADGTVAVAVGVGEPGKVTSAALRKAAAALGRAVEKRATLATSLTEVEGLDGRTAAQAVVEGISLALYRYNEVRTTKKVPALTSVTIVADEGRHRMLASGLTRGSAAAGAASLARDLANTPPSKLQAADVANRAVEIAGANGLGVEVWDNARLAQERCNGLLAVNAGSVHEARLVKLTYTARNATSTIALVGKGVTFDSGGLSLKPSDGMMSMKMDMSGAAAVLAAMGALKAFKPKVNVIGYLVLTDNMPSGSALKVSDVITYRNGTTVEVMNTDAEGRLVMADALILAVEADVDAIVDIATLTGACMSALGLKIAGVMGTNDALLDQIETAAHRADEPVWHLPLPAEYRKLLDSEVADLKNIGGPYGGALTAGLFLKEFVGSTPWAHLDVAGPMRVDLDEDWKVKGATGVGARLFLELLDRFDADAIS